MISVTQAIGTAIFLALAANLCYKWFKNLYNPEKEPSGTSLDTTPIGTDRTAGADKLRKKAEGWARSHDGKVIGPVELEWNGLHAHYEFIVVGWFGALGVNCLGYIGTIYGTVEEEEWTQEKNGERSSFPNPLPINQNAARVLRGVLMDNGLRNLTNDVVTVYTGFDVKLAIPRRVAYHTSDSFIAMLRRSDRFNADKGADVEALCKLLQP